MNENERIVCEFLRKIAPSREWEYLGEVEHYWIGEFCDELNKQLKAENAKLRELVQDFDKCLDTALWLASEAGYPVMPDQKLFDSLRPRMRELGIEVGL